MKVRARRSVAASRTGLLYIVLVSFFINILLLTGPIYMLQVFDRVIASRSTDTLIYLTLIAGIALLTLAALEAVRTFTMVRLATWLDRRISALVFTASVSGTLSSGRAPSAQGLRDVASIRTFLTGPNVTAILDAPWTPIFLTVIFVLHPMLGSLALAGAVLLLALAVGNELATRKPLTNSGVAGIRALYEAEAAARNASAVGAMGLAPNLLRRWDTRNAEMLDALAAASGRSATLTAASRLARQLLQIGILGLGAWLVLGSEITPGMMIASSILMSRALAPVDQAIGSWKSAVGARAAYARIKQQIERAPRRGGGIRLPKPEGRLLLDRATYFHPGASEPTLEDVSLSLEPGECLAVIGPTAAGKTTLAQLVVGNAKPRHGHVRLDSAELSDWDPDDLGRYIGYLPQNIELFWGSVRDNIARLGEAADADIVAAARLAGVHELILQLPNGYATLIGDDGVTLSGGQRQRIALARAVFGPPSLVVLDEPNSNLDAAGEAALVGALQALKASGTTVVVIAHRPSVLRHVDKVVVLRNGKVDAFGPVESVVPALIQSHAAPAVATG